MVRTATPVIHGAHNVPYSMFPPNVTLATQMSDNKGIERLVPMYKMLRYNFVG